MYSYGSNSQKTVEYFSKALGEKTISRDNISINRDKRNIKTGRSDSDQIMARALMTPDELRRMDNDLCIIFEKGIKPVKANKYYYYRHSMAKELKVLEISHNDIGEIERGNWRTYNPYNPYTEEGEEENQADLKIDSLDDLFDDDPPKKEEKEAVKISTEKSTTEIDPIFGNDSFSNIEDSTEDIEEETDLRKELEAKFDELFGPIEDDD